MRRITEPKLIAGFVLLLVLLSINTLVSSSNINTVSRNRQLVGHTYEVTAELGAVLSTLADAETGQHDFVITGQEAYLAPYTAALASVHQRLVRLQGLTKDSPEQQRRIADLVRVIEAKLSELTETIQLRRRAGEPAARRVLLSGRGKAEMDSIRVLIAQMESAEHTLLARREEESIASEQRTRLTFTGATVVRLVLLVIAYVVLARFLAERQRTADALQQREEWLHTTLRSIGDAVIATDAKGAVLFMNRVAEQLTGWTQEEASGKDAGAVFVIVHETTRAAVESSIRQVLQENLIVGLANHTILVARDGKETFIDDSAAPIRDASGRMIGVVLVFRDISERKSAQEQRERHLAEVERLNSRLQRAMTETHHRVKNNLQLISAMVDLQAQEGDGTLSAAEVKRLEGNIRTLAAVQDVLTQESKRARDIHAISPKEILDKLLPIYQQSAPRHTITAHLEEVLLPGSQATALALLANELLANAIKHGRGGVHLAMVTDAARNVLEMCVTDDGPGFPAGFDPLEASHTGLELMVMLAQWDLNGELDFGNHAGGGGEVRLRMPLPEPVTHAVIRQEANPLLAAPNEV